MTWAVPLPERPDISQALRYMGVPGEGDAAARALLERARQALYAAARPRAVSLRAEREALAPYLRGEDITRHLEGCGACVLLACTLGAAADAVQRAANTADMAYAVALDALASVLAEQVADAAERTLREEATRDGLFLTGRFSPGYGDYPIELQNELSLASNRRDVGREFEVLVEGTSRKRKEQLFGRNSQNKVIVFDASDDVKVGDYLRVRVTDCTPATLLGVRI